MNENPIINILLVEDNDDDILMVHEALEDARLVNLMHVVRDGVEAMAYLRREGEYAGARRPGIVLLDINMPRKGGFEVLNEMKADPLLRAIPVVMLTTSTRDQDIVKSYEDGACSYVTKPLHFDDFKSVVRQFSLYWALVATLPPVD